MFKVWDFLIFIFDYFEYFRLDEFLFSFSGVFIMLDVVDLGFEGIFVFLKYIIKIVLFFVEDLVILKRRVMEDGKFFKVSIFDVFLGYVW